MCGTSECIVIALAGKNCNNKCLLPPFSELLWVSRHYVEWNNPVDKLSFYVLYQDLAHHQPTSVCVEMLKTAHFQLQV